MSQIHPILPEAAERALIKAEDYSRIYQQSVQDNDEFWAQQAKRLDWFRLPRKIAMFRGNFPIFIFAGSKTARSMSAITASIGTWKRAATRQQSSGKATIQPGT